MILATNNKGKTEEIKKILEIDDVYSLKDKGIDIDIVEDKDTFLGNAKKKAKEIFDITHEATIADDSGLSILALNGFPGVMPHRFLGDDATDKERNIYLINEVNKLDDRRAQVICSIVYYDGVSFLECEGVLDGNISLQRRGNNGFGFDEIFELSSGRTLAELESNEKNEISTRSIATKKLKRML